MALRALCLMACAALAQMAGAAEIRVGHALSHDSHVGRALVKAAERISADSGGRLVLKQMGNGAAGNDQKLMQDAIDGNIECDGNRVLSERCSIDRNNDRPKLLQNLSGIH